MINITIAGRTSKYVNISKVDTKTKKGVNQAVFTVFSRDNQGNTQLIKCVYRGLTDETLKSLFVVKGKDDKDKTTYHSRMIYIQGRLGLENREQQLPVVGFEDVYEEVMAPSPVAYVSALEFLDASPDKTKDSANSNMTVDEKEAKRKEIEARKAKRQAKQDNKLDETVEETVEEIDEEIDEDTEEIVSRELGDCKKSFIDELDDLPLDENKDLDFDLPYGAK